MPRIRLLAQANVGDVTRYRGAECDVPADVAQSLVQASRAEIIRGEQPDTPERSARIERTAERHGTADGGRPGQRRPERRGGGV